MGWRQVHMPLFDPAELLLLAVFRDPGATSAASRVFGSGASLVGKLRLRLSTLAAGRMHAAALPLCADRKAGGGRAATAHLRIKARSSASMLGSIQGLLMGFREDMSCLTLAPT